MNPLGRVIGLPAEVVGALRVLPQLARDMAEVREATRDLPDVREATTAMARNTSTLPDVLGSLETVAQGTAVLRPMDERMQTIEGAMPVLVEVQQHLAQLPETRERLDRGVTQMAAVLERLLVSMDELNTTLGNLEGSVGPLGRLAGKLPGGRRDRDSDAPPPAVAPPPADSARVSDGPPPPVNGGE